MSEVVSGWLKSAAREIAAERRSGMLVPMRVLIQNCLSGKFYSRKRKWVADPEKAEDFEKTLRAWAEIGDRKLSGLRIVLKISGGVPDVRLANVGTERACGRSEATPTTTRMAQ